VAFLLVTKERHPPKGIGSAVVVKKATGPVANRASGQISRPLFDLGAFARSDGFHPVAYRDRLILCSLGTGQGRIRKGRKEINDFRVLMRDEDDHPVLAHSLLLSKARTKERRDQNDQDRAQDPLHGK
jgi:hypothetical protein